MKKDYQNSINKQVEAEYKLFLDRFPKWYEAPEKRLNYSKATVRRYEFGHLTYILLLSYDCPIAIIKQDPVLEVVELFDFLRFVYGYTATSALHIAKFKKAFGTNQGYPDIRCYQWRSLGR